MSSIRIEPVTTAPQLAAVRTLFEEYWAAFGFSPCFQGFSDELVRLPGDYAPPDGRLALATVDGEIAGCAALRRFDVSSCEAKRLYVRPTFRGRGIGSELLAWVIAEARTGGYRAILADTLPTMERALALYAQTGFVTIPPYAANPTPGTICVRLDLVDEA